MATDIQGRPGLDRISGDLGPSPPKEGLAGVCVVLAGPWFSPGRWNAQGQTWWRECIGFEGPTRCGSTGNKSCFGGDAKVKEQRLDAVVSEDILDDMIQCAPTFLCYLMTGYLSDSVQQRTCLLAALAALTMLGGAGQAADYIIGADLSFLKQAEERGAVFQDQGQAKPGLRLFKDHGYNWVRLRLFHTPTNLPNNLAYTIASASDAKKLGFEFLLNYHYSDTWADPQKQFIPKAWQGKSHAELIKAGIRGVGIFWWEPAVTGGLRSRGFFDNDGNALPVIGVFDRFTRK